MCKKQKLCLEKERLPHDVVELIMERLPTKTLQKFKCVSKQWKATLETPFFQKKHVQELIMERLPVKSLVRFKSVSKQWKSTIESRLFQEWHLAHRQQSGDPDILMVSTNPIDPIDSNIEYLTTFVLRSSISSAVKIPTPWSNINYKVSSSSIDGLVCLYDPQKPCFVVNPATRWFHPLPLCGLQKLIIDLGQEAYFELGHDCLNLAFGKDKVSGTYKPVWLYNSSELGLENTTTCEVFDFTTNSWRYVTPSAPCRILSDPVFADGSLHWFTEDDADRKTTILSFDLHTETFQVMLEPPYMINRCPDNKRQILLCNLDNRLCISRMIFPNQAVWSLHPDTKEWEHICMIDLDITRLWHEIPTTYALMPLALLNDSPLAILDDLEKEKRLLFYDRNDSRALVIGELYCETMYDRVFHRNRKTIGYPVCYFPSLLTI